MTEPSQDNTDTVPAPIELSPAWTPLKLNPISNGAAIDAVKWWQPKIDDSRGLVITGNWSCLYVIDVFDRQRIKFTIPAEVRITGWELGAGCLYIQDGAVLSRWELSTPKSNYIQNLMSARNLISGQTWSKNNNGPIDDEQKAALYNLPEEEMKLQSALLQAINKTNWFGFAGNLLITLIGGIKKLDQSPPNFDPAKVAAYKSMLATLIPMFDPSLRAADFYPERGDLAFLAFLGFSNMYLKEASDVWTAAYEKGLCFSAPVVRTRQLETPVRTSVFALASNGELHGMDDSLQYIETVNYGAPDSLVVMFLTPDTFDPYFISYPCLILLESTIDTSCNLFYRPQANQPLPRIDASSLKLVTASSDPPNPYEGISTAGDSATAYAGIEMQISNTKKGFYVMSGEVFANVEGGGLQWTHIHNYENVNSGYVFYEANVNVASDVLVLGFGQKAFADEDNDHTGDKIRGPEFKVLPALGHMQQILARHTLNAGNLPSPNQSIARLLAFPCLYNQLKDSNKILFTVTRNTYFSDAIKMLMDESKGTSAWDQFITDNKSRYGGKDSGWDLGQCPLPDIKLDDYIMAFNIPPIPP